MVERAIGTLPARTGWDPCAGKATANLDDLDIQDHVTEFVTHTTEVRAKRKEAFTSAWRQSSDGAQELRWRGGRECGRGKKVCS